MFLNIPLDTNYKWQTARAKFHTLILSGSFAYERGNMKLQKLLLQTSIFHI